MNYNPPIYAFIWYGDGYYVYHHGIYIGTDDQLDMVEIANDLGAAVYRLKEGTKWERDLLLESIAREEAKPWLE